MAGQNGQTQEKVGLAHELLRINGADYNLPFPRLFFVSYGRIVGIGNCCVSTSFGGAHQWAKAHILVCADFPACGASL
jgi:hypothetical protein